MQYSVQIHQPWEFTESVKFKAIFRLITAIFYAFVKLRTSVGLFVLDCTISNEPLRCPSDVVLSHWSWELIKLNLRRSTFTLLHYCCHHYE